MNSVEVYSALVGFYAPLKPLPLRIAFLFPLALYVFYLLVRHLEQKLLHAGATAFTRLSASITGCTNKRLYSFVEPVAFGFVYLVETAAS